MLLKRVYIKKRHFQIKESFEVVSLTECSAGGAKGCCFSGWREMATRS